MGRIQRETRKNIPNKYHIGDQNADKHHIEVRQNAFTGAGKVTNLIGFIQRTLTSALVHTAQTQCLLPRQSSCRAALFTLLLRLFQTKQT